MLKIYTLLIFFIFTSLPAEIINKIEINGNQRVSIETIKMFSNISVGDDFDSNDFNSTLKKLYDTNFFNLIELKIEANILKINVEEFPIIQNVSIEGIDKQKIKDELLENISFKPRTSFKNLTETFRFVLFLGDAVALILIAFLLLPFQFLLTLLFLRRLLCIYHLARFQ